MTWLKLQRWDDVISDCNSCIRLSPNNMKAHFYIAEAQIQLHDFESALGYAKRAYDLAVQAKDKSLQSYHTLVLKCRYKSFQDREKKRLRESSDLEKSVLAMMYKEQSSEVECCDEADRQDVAKDWEDKIAQVKETFLKAREKDRPKREVPDWALDDIYFEFMLDPVITKSGKSYERSSIMEHLRRSQTDPVTREPLDPSELRPNLNLKAACEKFLEENGWAADW